MKQRVLFYSSVASMEYFSTQKFYVNDINILQDLDYHVILSNRILDALRFWRYDFVFAYFYRKSFFVAFIAKLCGRRTYFTGGIDDLNRDYASSWRYFIQKFFFKLCYYISESCIIVSDADLANIMRFFHKKKYNHISFSEHSIDTNKFIASDPKYSYFTTIVWMDNIGNVIRKGVDKAIYVFYELKKYEEFRNYKFVIIGKNGAGTEYLTDIVAQLNLADDVIFTGNISEDKKINYLKKSRYYFQLSLYEGFGLAALEALCAGNILIHSGKGGLGNPIYKNNSILFDLNADFDVECNKLYSSLCAFDARTINLDYILKFYNNTRRKEDFDKIIHTNHNTKCLFSKTRFS